MEEEATLLVFKYKVGQLWGWSFSYRIERSLDTYGTGASWYACAESARLIGSAEWVNDDLCILHRSVSNLTWYHLQFVPERQISQGVDCIMIDLWSLVTDHYTFVLVFMPEINFILVYAVDTRWTTCQCWSKVQELPENLVLGVNIPSECY